MPVLYTISFPELAADDLYFIDRFRQVHDAPQRDAVAAHVTLLFGCSTVERARYTQHVASVAATSGPVRFVCRHAMLGTDDAVADRAHVFLVPDEGFSGLSRLHDRLYTGPLEPCLRLDLPYVPHITIGTMNDRARAKALCDELNRGGLCIEGTVRTLTIGTLEDGRLKPLSSHVLGEP